MAPGRAIGVPLYGVGTGRANTVAATLSKTAVVSFVASWLVTANPRRAAPAPKFVVPTCDHAEPSGETYPVTVIPVRVSFSHVGVACVPPIGQVVAAPVDGRVMNSSEPLGVTSRIT